MKKIITTALAVMTVILIIFSFAVLKIYKFNQVKLSESNFYNVKTAKVLPAVDTKYIDYGSVVIYNE